MAASPQAALSGLARALVQHGRLLEAEALPARRQSANPNDFLVEVINRGLMSAADIALFRRPETFGSPTLDLAAFDTAICP
jgi:type IV pilus assembly protein PilB